MRDIMLIVHFIGLAMAVGTGFANLFLGIAASKMEIKDRIAFMQKTSILMGMGHTGITLLVISGLYLATPYWSMLGNGEMPYFVAKLVLVGIIILLIGALTAIASKAKKQNKPELMAKMKPLGMLTLLTGILIIIMAVSSFH